MSAGAVLARARRHVVAVDLALTLLVSVLMVVRAGGAPGNVVDSGALLVVPLGWRRARPVASAATVLATAFVLSLMVFAIPRVDPIDVGFSLGNSMAFGELAVPAALYSVTAHGPRRAGWAALAAVVAGAVWAGVLFHEDRPFGVASFVYWASYLVPFWGLGRLSGMGRERLEALRDRTRLLEAEQDRSARLAAARERARIAQQTYDVVANALTRVIEEAEAGRRSGGGSTEGAQALAIIGTSGRTALADLRRLLGVLREEQRV